MLFNDNKNRTLLGMKTEELSQTFTTSFILVHFTVSRKNRKQRRSRAEFLNDVREWNPHSQIKHLTQERDRPWKMIMLPISQILQLKRRTRRIISIILYRIFFAFILDNEDQTESTIMHFRLKCDVGRGCFVVNTTDS